MKRYTLLATALVVLASTAAPTGQATTSEPKLTAFAAVDRNAGESAKVGDEIFSYAELGMQEYEVVRLVADRNDDREIEAYGPSMSVRLTNCR